MTGGQAPQADALPEVIAGYTPRPGVADEMFDASGRLRPVWEPLIAYLSQVGPETLEENIARGRNYLRDAGVYFRQYSNTPGPESDWPLSPLPILIHQDEWTEICAGLTQRADLLEQVMADLYGPGDLVSQGHLPAELIARAPGWLRPMVGVPPASGHFLHLLSFEIARNPDGSWFVLGDRTQAPSGAGFALENRMATTRIFNDFLGRSAVLRLAGFFRDFRAAMDGPPGLGSGNGTGRCAIVTPGPNNASYFEHTYIARYLGLPLLEGEDLIVQNGRVMVRTVEGPQPLGTLWRRVDPEFMDPLELREDSRLGTPGLLNALRQGSVHMINALGSGVLEMRAMMAFLPKISEVLTGAPLRLPNIATWWCGTPEERAYVMANAKRMMIGGALDQDLPLDIGATTALGGEFRSGARESIESWVEAEAAMLVGQELVTLSTAPAYDAGRLVPRPMTVRVTAARTREGWVFMPGGYARIGASDDVTALGMQRGGTVADVWVMSDAPVQEDSLFGPTEAQRLETEPLPSRAAENLYWLGRYIERTEDAFRLVRAFHLRLAETGDPDDPRLNVLATYMTALGLDPSTPVPPGLIERVSAARSCAGKVRDRFSTDGWAALQDLAATLSQMAQTRRAGDDCARGMSVLLRKITGFSGLVHENMYRFVGWRFLAFGRALERADTLASSLIAFTADGLPLGSSDIALELADSTMAHRRRYLGEASRQTALDLLACDAQNPRAILFQLGEMVELAALLPQPPRHERMSRLSRALLPLQTQIAVTRPEDLTLTDLAQLRGALSGISDLLSTEYLR